MTPTRTPSVLILAAVLTACGGGDQSPPSATRSAADSSATETGSDAADGDVPTTAPPDLSTEPTTTTTDVLATTTTEWIDIVDAEPWRVELGEPVGPRLDGWVDQPPIAPTPTDLPADLDARLAWIYTDLIELWRGDLRLTALGMNGIALDAAQRHSAPAAVIDLLGAAGSVLRDSYTVIAASSELASASQDPDAALFEAWSEYAARWVDAAELVRLTMVDALELAPDDQACLLAIIDDDDDCDGPGEDSAIELMTELDVMFSALDAVDIDDPGAYAAAGLEFDECAAWDAAVAATGLSSDEELRIWIALDDDDLDVYIVSLSECGWEENRVEDSEPDAVADRAAFASYLAAIIDAIVASGYDETVYDMGGGAEDERRYYEAMSALATGQVLTAARDSASLLWPAVYDPDLAAKLYVVRGIEIDDWVDLTDVELDWDDLGTWTCEVWTGAVEDYSADQRVAIDAAVDDLGLADSLIPEVCD